MGPKTVNAGIRKQKKKKLKKQKMCNREVETP